MDETKLIPLPATLAEFTAYQEGLLGRSLNDNEREGLERYLEIFNAVVAEIDKALKANRDPWFQGFMKSARFWVLYAKEVFSNAQQV